MAEPSLISVLHHLRCLTEAHDDRRQSDRQLLERFQQQHDETAFAMLMRRHGRLVLSAIRRVLHEEADVEDAFQATFLVLLRKVSSVRWQSSLGSWLFGVAHRIALKARANALRRQRRESEAGRKRSLAEEQSADLSWREALSLLHEELDRLPDKYRMPLLLCYLDGKSREEAAGALGCTVNTIKWRLERGRELLRTRLIRRRVTLSGALLAAVVDAPAVRSVAPALIQATLNAARTGSYRSTVDVLMKAAAPALWMSKTRLAVGVFLAVSLLAVGGGSTLSPPSAPPESPATRPSERDQSPPVAPHAKTKDTLVVRGRVLGPDGKPIKGARLYSPHAEKDVITVVQRSITDAEGRFRFELPRADARPAWDRALIAAADGYGVQWIALPGENPSGELKLRLAKDLAIQGRILSTEGKPVAAARVQVVSLKTKADDRVDDFLAAWQRQWGSAFVQGAQKHLVLPLDTILPVVTTDREGRFRIPGIGAERVAEIKIQGTGIARASLYIVSRPDFDPASVNKTALDNARVELGNSRPPLLYGPTFDYIAESGRVVEGTIRAADSGDPLPGFTVSYIVGSRNSIRSVSDKQGLFRLEGMPKGKGLPLEVVPPANSSWLRTSAWTDNSGSLRPLKMEIRVRRGVLVSGRVIDRTTGKGVMSAMRFVPLPDNKFFGKPGAEHQQTAVVITDAEGRFRMTILPGPGVLMAEVRAREKTKGGQEVMPYTQAEFDAADRRRVPMETDFKPYRTFIAADNLVEVLNRQNAVKYLDLTPDAAGAACNLFVDRGQTKTLQLQDDEGKPLSGVTIAGLSDTWFFHSSILTLADTESACTIYGLDPRRPRRLIFIHSKRRLAGTMTVHGDEKEPPATRLARTGTVTGRVLDLEGRPIAGADVNLWGSDPTLLPFYDWLKSHSSPVRTGADGRFRIEGLVPDLGFSLLIRRGRTSLADPRVLVMSLKPGETRNLGDLRVKPIR